MKNINLKTIKTAMPILFTTYFFIMLNIAL